MIRPVVIAVFAHPDDEAFGPGGTLALLSITHDVYIIAVTGGEAGMCSIEAKGKKLSEIRNIELLKSSKILGVKKVFFLGYVDGTLSNNLYHEIAGKIEKIFFGLKPDIILTFEPRGISGHIDHIAVSNITTFVFKRKKIGTELWYFCISEKARRREPEDYFIYFPDGYKDEDIDKTIDVTSVWDIRVEAIKAHRSQSHDGQTILKVLERLPKVEHFLIEKS